ncbi:NADH-quinone oxidoreductase subunit L [Enterobacteriaceae endosymbiont of Donacia versicolorea]|uniref:NADH-quinone oxidoreductase subunit L n=1 Tax=Enterobacteriaceae endosymbiont of Donacia versicolorea TaxID=2675788 RepID=UPI0014496BD1|nr:NADH-quinone oxidoreductase subunit L [Enterobacteriaceae endosymbiont of Donacia versicolorea]QJC32210.1 NADH-quinone oxidoreductase subunit L [Enterobacteriaceae endosymbiont of Donacia versicolorea]
MKYLFLIILMPLISFLILSLFSNYLNKVQISIIGVSFIGISSIITLIIGFIFFNKNLLSYRQFLWQMLKIDNLHINVSLYLDMLSLIMLSITTWIGFFIHIFSIWYMKNEEEYSKFFAYTNLFIASMALLILADNFILMFFGWELVGVCSYLLIGFFHEKTFNGLSAIKTFLITRFSDIFLIIGIFLIFQIFHTLNFSKISSLILLSNIYYKSYYLKIISIMLIIGAIGKSAQFPLNTWLINAMVGPTPASALIHAATMVTAGIYLILRNNILFLMNSNILFLISIIGSITILLSGCSALVQNNIKRILAYSTMSQIGYMFLALGINSWHATLFHVISHAFFKALLFLCVASIIFSYKNEQNILKIGKIKKYLPFIYYCFLFGSISLLSFPIITISGFTKEKILYEIIMKQHNLLFIISIIGSFFTSLYTIRLIYIICYKKNNTIFTIINSNNKFTHNFPLLILSILSSFIGIKLLPIKNNFLLPNKILLINHNYYFIMQIISIIISIISFLLYMFYSKNIIFIKKITKNYFNKLFFINHFFLNGCYIDFVYKKIFVNNFIKILSIIKNDPISKFINFLVINTINQIGKILLISENGYIRWYMSLMYLGLFLIFLYLIILNHKYY